MPELVELLDICDKVHATETASAFIELTDYGVRFS